MFCIGIVLYHYYVKIWHETIFSSESLIGYVLSNVFTKGSYGVPLFFLISGFLMAYQYKPKLQDGELEKGYFTKIAKRILPFYWSAQVIGILLAVIDKILWNGTVLWIEVNIYQIFLALTLTNYGLAEYGSLFIDALWYINVLIICYTLYYLILKLSKKFNNCYLPLCILFFILGWISRLWVGVMPFFDGRTVQGYMMFFGGVLEYEIWKSEYLDKRKRKYISYILLMLIVGIGALEILFGIEKVLGNTFMFWCLGYCPAILYLSLECTFIKKVLLSKVILFFGRKSNSVYFSHEIVIFIVMEIENLLGINSQYSIGLLIITIIAVMVNACCFEYLVKRIFIKWYISSDGEK